MARNKEVKRIYSSIDQVFDEGNETYLIKLLQELDDLNSINGNQDMVNFSLALKYAMDNVELDEVQSKILALHQEGYNQRELGEFMEISQQAIHLRLKSIAKAITTSYHEGMGRMYG